MSTKNIVRPSFRVGDWVEVLKGDIEVKKGTLAVVADAPQKVTGWDIDNNTYDVTGYNVRIVFNTPNGGSYYTHHDCKNVVKIEAPRFLVGWNTECNDPMMYFKTLTGARDFVKKLKARKGMGRKVVEVSIYKRN